jgi:hypothetical protein
MGSGTASAEVGQCFGGTLYILFKQIGNSIARQLSTTGVLEYRFIGAIPDELTQGRGGFWPQWAKTLFAAFAIKANLSGTLQMEFLATDSQSLTHPRTRVVKEKQKSAVPSNVVLSRLYRCNDGTRFLRLEIHDRPEGRFLGGNGKATILVGARYIMAKQVLRKTADGGQTTVACRRGVRPLRFDVVQEGQHRVRFEIVEAEMTYEDEILWSRRCKGPAS